MSEGSVDQTPDKNRISVDTGFELTELIVGSEGRSEPLDQDVIRIGSKVGNDIVLQDGDIASFHCEIWQQRDHYVLVHRASEQATLLNGYPVEFRLLKPGDQIQVGEVSIRAVSNSESEEDSPELADVENLFEEDEAEDQKQVRANRLSGIEPTSNRSSGERTRAATRTRTSSGSGVNKEMMLQILLGLSGLIVILLAVVHFFG